MSRDESDDDVKYLLSKIAYSTRRVSGNNNSFDYVHSPAARADRFFSKNRNKDDLEELDRNYSKYFTSLCSSLHYDVRDSKKLNNFSESMKRRYFGEDLISRNQFAYSQLNTDKFVCVMRQAIELYKGPKYVYYYDHRNRESFAKSFSNSPLDTGVVHGDELISMFNWSLEITPVTEGIDFVVSEQILDLWVNFATYGNPNGKGKEIWKPAESSKFRYLYIKDGLLEMRNNLFDSVYEFWKSLT